MTGELQILRMLGHKPEVSSVLWVESTEGDVFYFIEIVVTKNVVRLKQINSTVIRQVGTYW